jgi:precorrin-6x reductase
MDCLAPLSVRILVIRGRKEVVAFPASADEILARILRSQSGVESPLEPYTHDEWEDLNIWVSSRE